MGILRVRVLYRDLSRNFGAGLMTFFHFTTAKIAKHIMFDRMLGRASTRIHWTCYPRHYFCEGIVRDD
jgi:hypothetical protein